MKPAKEKISPEYKGIYSSPRSSDTPRAAERVRMRLAIESAFMVDGLEQYEVEGRKQNSEKLGNC